MVSNATCAKNMATSKLIEKLEDKGAILVVEKKEKEIYQPLHGS